MNAGVSYAHLFSVRPETITWQPWLSIKTVAVNDKRFRTDAELCEGTVHGEEGGMKDIDLVDLLRCHDAYCPGHRLLLNLLPQGIALLLRQLLRVVEVGVVVVGRQDDGGSIDATGETATTGLVASGLHHTFIIMWYQFPFSAHPANYQSRYASSLKDSVPDDEDSLSPNLHPNPASK